MSRIIGREDDLEVLEQASKPEYPEFIVPEGLKKTLYSQELVHSIVSLADLMKKGYD